MTEKELLYLEDAIGHEAILTNVCQDIVDNLEDEDLVSFMEDEIKIHKSNYKKLYNLMEAKKNE